MLLGWYDMRLTEDAPISARLPPEEERVNSGCGGLDMARDCLDPGAGRLWLEEYGPGPMEVECARFIADAGWGSEEL